MNGLFDLHKKCYGLALPGKTEPRAACANLVGAGFCKLRKQLPCSYRSGCMRRCQPPKKQPVGLRELAMWVKEAWEWRSHDLAD